jgi:hypothetical protein
VEGLPDLTVVGDPVIATRRGPGGGIRIGTGTGLARQRPDRAARRRTAIAAVDGRPERGGVERGRPSRPRPTGRPGRRTPSHRRYTVRRRPTSPPRPDQRGPTDRPKAPRTGSAGGCVA